MIDIHIEEKLVWYILRQVSQAACMSFLTWLSPEPFCHFRDPADSCFSHVGPEPKCEAMMPQLRTVLSLPRADRLIFFTPWSWSHDADISAGHLVCPYTGFDDSGNDFIFQFKFNVIPIDIELKISQHNADDQLLRPCNFYHNRIMNTASAADILTNGDINCLCKKLRVALNDIA